MRRHGQKAGLRALCAGSRESFTLYVVHYPTWHLPDAVLPETLPAYDLWLSGLRITVCFVFAARSERTFKQFRRYTMSFGRRLAEILASIGPAKSQKL